MKIAVTILAVMVLLSTAVFAASTATQTFNVKINEINELTVSGNPGGLTINTATAGSDPVMPTDNSTTYSVTTNGTAKKLTGQITTGGEMPTYMTLELKLAAPTVGVSGDFKSIYAFASTDLVTDIATVADGTGNTITYYLNATAASGTYTQTSKTITLTLCAQ